MQSYDTSGALSSGGGAQFECCVYKLQQTNPADSTFKSSLLTIFFHCVFFVSLLWCLQKTKQILICYVQLLCVWLNEFPDISKVKRL